MTTATGLSASVAVVALEFYVNRIWVGSWIAGRLQCLPRHIGFCRQAGNMGLTPGHGILCGASAYSEKFRKHGIGDEPFAVEQWVVLVFQPLAHISDVFGLCRQAHYARIGGGDCFFHCPAPPSLTMSRAMSLPLNCESLPRCEKPILPRSFIVRNFRSDMWR